MIRSRSLYAVVLLVFLLTTAVAVKAQTATAPPAVTYNITYSVTADANGSVSVTLTDPFNNGTQLSNIGVYTVPAGANVSFTMEPHTGAIISSFIVDGVDHTPPLNPNRNTTDVTLYMYIMENISRDHTLSLVFSPDPGTPTLTPTPTVPEYTSEAAALLVVLLVITLFAFIYKRYVTGERTP